MHPILFHLGSKAFPSYGVFVTLGYIVSFLIILYLAKKQGLATIEIAAYLLFLILATAIGGKLYLFIFHFVKNPFYFFKFPKEILKVISKGGVFYGGLIAGVLFSVWYLHKVHLPFWKISDTVGPSAAVGHTIGRIGCFLGGCCFGKPSNLPWAIQFPQLSPPVHPTQLYEAGLNFINFVFLLALYKNKKFDGQVLCLYLINYSLIRFFLEFFRGDPGRGYVFRSSSIWVSLSIPQLISLIGLATGVTFLFILKKQKPLSP